MGEEKHRLAYQAKHDTRLLGCSDLRPVTDLRTVGRHLRQMLVGPAALLTHDEASLFFVFDRIYCLFTFFDVPQAVKVAAITTDLLYPQPLAALKLTNSFFF